MCSVRSEKHFPELFTPFTIDSFATSKKYFSETMKTPKTQSVERNQQ